MHCCARSAGASWSGRHPGATPCQPHRSARAGRRCGGAPASARSISMPRGTQPATLALEDGVSPHVVAAMLGHASVATTLGVYAHVTHVSLDALTEAINSHHHPRVDLRVISGETTPRDEGTNEGTELKPRFPSTEKECRERGIEPLRNG